MPWALIRRGRNRPVPPKAPLILVVDDEPGIRLLLGAGLRRRFDVLLASDGREALDYYRRLPGAIALVLLDLRMPDLNGEETLAALRDLDPGVRCCLMTAFYDRSDEAELLQRGALAVLGKPFDVVELPELVDQLLAGASRVEPR